jgi:hypothetical protein
VDNPTDKDKQSSPPWLWAAIVALSLLIVTAGAIVGMVTTDEDGSAGNSPQAASSETGATATGSLTEAPPPLVPPTVSIPALTDPGVDTGGFEPIPPEPIPPITVPTVPTVPTDTSGSAGVGTWPAGQSGYTVIVASVPESQGRTTADATAQRAIAAGLPAVGVLRSGDFSSLRPGFWVTYTGVYTSLAQAQAALPQARAAGFSSAYTRRVSP